MANKKREVVQGSPDDEAVPPHDLEVERLVLGSVLMRPELYDYIADTVDESDFYRTGHQRIFKAMSMLSEATRYVDMASLRDELSRAGDMGAAGGPAYLASLVDGLPATDVKHLSEHINILKEKSRLRKAAAAARAVIQAVSGGERRAVDIASDAAETLYDLGGAALPGKPVSLRELVAPGMEALERAYSRREAVTGLSTGFAEVDDMLAGMHPADLIVLAARTSIGKTALALGIARNVGARKVKEHERRATTLVFSLEMSKEQLFLRLLSSEGRIDSQRLRTGRLIDSDWGKITNALNALAELDVTIDDTPDVGVREIRARSRQVKAEKGLALIVVDYIQLMRGRGKFDSRSHEVGTFSKGLKAIAKELQVPVLALAQLSRAPEGKFGMKARKPQLTDIRESGSIEQDADVVLFIWRPEPKKDESGIITAISMDAELIVAKQRNGPTGSIPLMFTQEFVKFESAR